MKAIQITQPGEMQVVDLPMPQLHAGEVLVKIKYVGFCGSDLNTFLGRNPMVKMPVVPGHEVGAVIEQVGEGVNSSLQPGMIVTLNPYTNCGYCASCRNGRVNACEHNETLGVQRWGVMSEYAVVPQEKIIPVSNPMSEKSDNENLKTQRLCKREQSELARNLPSEANLIQTSNLKPHECALIEPMSVGFHAVARAQVVDNEFVMVIGCGMVGMGAIIRAARRGSTVIAVDLDDEKLQLAKRVGASFAINSKTEDLHSRVQEITSGLGCDAIIEAVGSPMTYVTAINEVSFTGRVVYIGYSKQDVAFQTKLFVQKELDIRGSRNALPADFRAVINYLQQGNCPTDELITAIVKPEKALEAMQKWAENPGKVFRILVEF